MRGTWWAAAAGAFIMAGCGDPTTSRLPVGARTIAVDAFPNVRARCVFLRETDHALYPELPFGTHLTVVDDTEDPRRDWGTRKVLVHVEDGEFKGVTGQVSRMELHPIN